MNSQRSNSKAAEQGASKEESASAFRLLHPAIQEQLYRMQWTELRSIQVQAIHALLKPDGYLIISAMTAGGKTEAAFLPILSAIVEAKQNGVRAVYIGPLKALINDQFRRLEDLCQRADIPVHKWHGDVSASAKKELLNEPSGVLLITPESVESLFINRTQVIPKLFHNLQFIVLDELHSFIGTERGAHLKSLIARLGHVCATPPRLVGLSATIGDIDLACDWLCPRSADNGRVITGEGEKTIKYSIRGYVRLDRSDSPATEDDPEEPTETEDDRQLARDIITAFYGKTALIFANSRARLEFYADLTRRMLEKEGRPNPFRIHHGSLSKAEREDTEEALRSGSPTATFCSSTLELGIDVGNICAVGQIGAPWSVSSLAQRLGRSGRRAGEASVLLMYVEEDDPDRQSSPIHKLYPQILQGTAMTELLLKKWCEPPESHRLHLSTLVQQVLSVIAERGGASAQKLNDLLIDKGSFINVDRDAFLAVLRSMGDSDLIEQTAEGDLILGLRGEMIVRDRDFYSTFSASQDMSVYHKGHLIGTVSAPPGLGGDGFLILAGRRWRILEIDEKRSEIVVEPSKGGRVPFFAGGGGADIHPRVRSEMLSVLRSDTTPAYLDGKAKEMLGLARSYARTAGILDGSVIREGDTVYWFTWAGSRTNRTLMGLGRFAAGLNVRDEEIALCFEKADPIAIKNAYLGFLQHCPTTEQLAPSFPFKVVEKYDVFLSESLQAANFARNSLDVAGALEAIRAGFAG
jgi:ATP-dependent Lhr-like helicase